MARGKKAAKYGASITAVLYCPTGQPLLPKAISSLERQTLPIDQYKVLLLADAASVAAHKTEAEISAIANLVWHQEPIADQRAARAAALDLADTPLLAFMDAKASAEPYWLGGYRRAFEAYGDIAHLIGGKVRPTWALARPSWLGDDLLGYLSLVDLGDETRFVAPYERVSSANFAVRAAEVKAIGGFPLSTDDHMKSMFADEADLVELLKLNGGCILYDPDAAVDLPISADQMTQSWFRRRAAWNAVADLLKPPLPGSPSTAERWQNMKDFLVECPPTDRTVRGLVLEQPDAARFQSQVSAVYDGVHCLLAGIDERDDD